jgi:alkylation response protein AidB-like acyl-CoA dehydrogenase
VRDGARWRIRGNKVFISNAREAGLLIVFAKTGHEAGIDGIGAFAVRSDSAGISCSEPQDKLGIRSAPTYGVRLDQAVQLLLAEMDVAGAVLLPDLLICRVFTCQGSGV